MAHYAQIDENNIVTRVLVIDQDVIDTGAFGDPTTWKQTSYNTRAGIHYGPNGSPDGGSELRKNFAGVGYTYDPTLDAFYAPQPYLSWTLNTDMCIWEPPYPMPIDGGNYVWHEDTLSWVRSDIS